MHPFLFTFDTIFVPAEIGCEVGLHEGERVAHLVSLYLGPNSWMWGGKRGWSMMVGAMRKGGMCDMSWVAPIVTLSGIPGMTKSIVCKAVHFKYNTARCVKLQKVCQTFSILRHSVDCEPHVSPFSFWGV